MYKRQVDADGSPQRVPHISWNPLYPAGGRTDFSGTALQNVQAGQECYFIHSYEAKPAAEEYRLADTVYGGRKVCAAAQKGCVIGTQFHPEKSGPVGLGTVSYTHLTTGRHPVCFRPRRRIRCQCRSES